MVERHPSHPDCARCFHELAVHQFHRAIDADLYRTDVDGIWCDFYNMRPVALAEYRRKGSPAVNNGARQVLTLLADAAHVAPYQVEWDDQPDWSFTVHRLDDGRQRDFDEQGYVDWQRRIRGFD